MAACNSAAISYTADFLSHYGTCKGTGLNRTDILSSDPTGIDISAGHRNCSRTIAILDDAAITTGQSSCIIGLIPRSGQCEPDGSRLYAQGSNRTGIVAEQSLKFACILAVENKSADAMTASVQCSPETVFRGLTDHDPV